jgi:hypothetical protein
LQGLPPAIVLPRPRDLQALSHGPANLVANTAKLPQAFCGRARGVRWIVEGPVLLSRRVGKDRAIAVGVAADGNHEVEGLGDKLVERLAGVSADVDADFRHRLDRQRIDASRSDAGAMNVPPLTGVIPPEALRHLRPAGVTGAEYQHSLSGHSLHL